MARHYFMHIPATSDRLQQGWSASSHTPTSHLHPPKCISRPDSGWISNRPAGSDAESTAIWAVLFRKCLHSMDSQRPRGGRGQNMLETSPSLPPPDISSLHTYNQSHRNLQIAKIALSHKQFFYLCVCVSKFTCQSVQLIWFIRVFQSVIMSVLSVNPSVLL